MAAIDAPQFLPPDSRKVVFAIGGSLLLHAVLLAWLPPLVRDVGWALPAMLEVRLVAEAPALVAPPPPTVRSAPAVKQPPAAASAAVAGVTPSPLPAASVPAQAQPVEASPAPRVATTSEPAPSPPIAVTPPDLRAAYLSNPRPPYPLAARRLGLEGRVTLRAEIMENGNCGRISVAQSSGHDVLDQAALQAVKQWRFVPAQRGGETVSAWAEIPISFRLRESATDS